LDIIASNWLHDQFIAASRRTICDNAYFCAIIKKSFLLAWFCLSGKLLFSKITNGGQTWSSVVRVNDYNSTRQQFFTSTAIDQVTGYLWFLFYDRRNYNDNRTDVYMAGSKDGGATFKKILRSARARSFPMRTSFLAITLV